MMTNQDLLTVIKESFNIYLRVGTSRSTAKLKPLHGSIASDLHEALGDGFSIQSQGYGRGRERIIAGRYYPKNVDITVSKNDVPVAGYAVKFVVRNYSQNSNNYFENMLGETINIRAKSIPYFQIFIVFEQVPYYKKGGAFMRYDVISEHNLDKYLVLSNDDPALLYHTPDKTLVALIRLKEKSPGHQFTDSYDYADYYKSVIDDLDLMTYSSKPVDGFGPAVIYNDYAGFIQQTIGIITDKFK